MILRQQKTLSNNHYTSTLEKRENNVFHHYLCLRQGVCRYWKGMGIIMTECLAVGAGGFAGAVLRYLAGLVPVKETTIFPVKTFIINVTGCIVIGFIAALVSRDAALNPRLILFLKTGLCGGFTTFSTFALETSDLLREGHAWTAFLYVTLSILAGVFVIIAEQHFIK